MKYFYPFILLALLFSSILSCGGAGGGSSADLGLSAQNCGNGKLDAGEACDDSNVNNGDGCNAHCAFEVGEASCGNGVLENDECCDDGNNVSGDGCSANCTLEKNNHPPSPPVLAAEPANGATWTPTRLYLSWNPSTDPDVGDQVSYDVYFILKGNRDFIPAGILPYKAGISSTHFIIQASTDNRAEYFPDQVTAIYLSPNNSYLWKVCARDSSGAQNCSETRLFNVDNSVDDLPTVQLTAPNDGASLTQLSVNLTWNAVSGSGIVYDVYLGVNGAVPMIVSTEQAATHFTMSGLVNQTAYQWKVRVHDLYGRSAESAVWTYNVGNLNMPTAPALAAQPADMGAMTAWAPTRLYLSWMASTDADVGDTVTYDVYFEPVMNAGDPLPMAAVPYRSGIPVGTTSFVIQASTDNRTQYKPNGIHAGMQTFLAPNSHYAWKVCANDGRNNPPGITCSPIRHFNTDSSVVGWWRFDEDPAGPLCMGALMGSGKTVCDYSGNNNHGVPNGGPVWLPPPDPMLLGGALQFDGVDDYVQITHSSMLNPPVFSIELKLKILSLGTNWPRIFQKRTCNIVPGCSDAIAGYNIEQPHDGTGRLAFLVSTGTLHRIYTMGGVPLLASHQVVGIYNGTSISLYLDTALQNTLLIMSPLVYSSNPLQIGAETVEGSFFNGLIDDAFIYSKVLSTEEINNNYNSN